MKRILVVFLALLLVGCTGQEQQETETIATATSAPAGLYDPDSLLEQQTNGAVWVYPLEGNNYTDFVPVGEKTVLVTDRGELTILMGEDKKPVSTMVTGTQIESNGMGFRASKTGVAYHVKKSNEVVWLNPMLQQITRIQLPKELDQVPVISLARNEIYYCLGENILAQDMDSGIARLVKQQACQSQKLVGSYFDGALLACEITDLDGTVQIHYISAETGQTMSRDNGIFYLDTYEERFLALRMDGTVLQQIIGSVDGICQSLQIPKESGTLYGVLSANGVLTCLDMTRGQKLSFYDLDSGKKTAEVMLEDVESPVTVKADAQYIWVLAQDRSTGKQALYRWDKEKSFVEDKGGSYLMPLYTAQSPDMDGIALQQEHVDWCNEQYGVRIAIWENALQYTGDYGVIAEHQPAVISDMLTQLEQYLPLFPTDFLRKTVEKGWIRIGLVRSIANGETWASFWQDGDCCILITPQADISEAFLVGLGYGIDSHVLGNSRAYDDWTNLNPGTFVYGGECEPKHYEGKYRYFTDELATQSILEDRSRLFYAAMQADSAEVFAANAMQKKLLCMCVGIREAYGLEEKTEQFPWEQYLDIPLNETE